MKYILYKLRKYQPEYNEQLKVLIFRKPLPVKTLFLLRYELKKLNIELNDLMVL